MKVQLLRAWPRRFEAVELELPEGARVGDALAAAGWDEDAQVVGYAVYGQRVERTAVLRDGDRLELLRPLEADPKLARRERVEQTRRQQGKR
jgi:putative ubiquitin-RnfH superfamily antitoxin RatB of RatAB toxin-antitoxin module